MRVRLWGMELRVEGREGEEGLLAGFLLHPVICAATELARDAHRTTVDTSASTRDSDSSPLVVQHVEGTIYPPVSCSIWLMPRDTARWPEGATPSPLVASWRLSSACIEEWLSPQGHLPWAPFPFTSVGCGCDPPATVMPVGVRRAV